MYKILKTDFIFFVKITKHPQTSKCRFYFQLTLSLVISMQISPEIYHSYPDSIIGNTVIAILISDAANRMYDADKLVNDAAISMHDADKLMYDAS